MYLKNTKGDFYNIMLKIKKRAYREWAGIKWINVFFYVVEFPIRLLM